MTEGKCEMREYMVEFEFARTGMSYETAVRASGPLDATARVLESLRESGGGGLGSGKVSLLARIGDLEGPVQTATI
jgi:hypothetical protein